MKNIGKKQEFQGRKALGLLFFQCLDCKYNEKK